MQEVMVLDVPAGEDLGVLSKALWEAGIVHRVVAMDARQLLLVGSMDDAQLALRAWRDWRAGKPINLPVKKEQADNAGWQLLARAIQTPVTTVIALLSIVGALIVTFDHQLGLMHWLTFYSYDRMFGVTYFSLPANEHWRLLTPIFLHFGWLHILFNLMWWWDLGRRVEILQGRVTLLGITMSIGLGSNIAQSLYSEISIFGGLSGVIYGLLGYCWMWDRFASSPRFAVPNAVVAFMMAWLVLCMVGFARLMGAGEVANAAHVGGLLMGLLLGFLAAMIGGDDRQ